MGKSKRGAIEISTESIIILILALIFLSMGLVFVRSMLSKIFTRFDEQISQEPEPPKPVLSRPISLSRNPIKAKEDTTEVLKVSIMNPTKKDWVNRQFINVPNLCARADSICFIDVNDNTEKCNTKSNAKKNDYDCRTGIFTGMDCTENSKKSPCLISNSNDEDMYCPYFTEENRDQNCMPKEGVEVYLSCDNSLMEEPFKRNIGSIKMNEFKTNILLMKMQKKVANGQYLCQVRVFGEENEYMEDLVVKIENE